MSSEAPDSYPVKDRLNGGPLSKSSISTKNAANYSSIIEEEDDSDLIYEKDKKNLIRDNIIVCNCLMTFSCVVMGA